MQRGHGDTSNGSVPQLTAAEADLSHAQCDGASRDVTDTSALPASPVPADVFKTLREACLSSRSSMAASHQCSSSTSPKLEPTTPVLDAGLPDELQPPPPAVRKAMDKSVIGDTPTIDEQGLELTISLAHLMKNRNKCEAAIKLYNEVLIVQPTNTEAASSALLHSSSAHPCRAHSSHGTHTCCVVVDHWSIRAITVHEDGAGDELPGTVLSAARPHRRSIRLLHCRPPPVCART